MKDLQSIKLANMKVSRKMGLLIAVSLLQLVCLLTVAQWAVQALDRGLEATRSEGRKEALALDIAVHADAIGLTVANGMLSSRFDDQTMDRILALRKEYVGNLEELSSLIASAEDRQRVQVLQETARQWREADNSLFEAEKAGKRSQTMAIYRKQVVPALDQLAPISRIT